MKLTRINASTFGMRISKTLPYVGEYYTPQITKRASGLDKNFFCQNSDLNSLKIKMFNTSN